MPLRFFCSISSKPVHRHHMTLYPQLTSECPRPSKSHKVISALPCRIWKTRSLCLAVSFEQKRRCEAFRTICKKETGFNWNLKNRLSPGLPQIFPANTKRLDWKNFNNRIHLHLVSKNAEWHILKSWNIINTWESTALLPMSQILDTDYIDYKIITKLTNTNHSVDAYKKSTLYIKILQQIRK